MIAAVERRDIVPVGGELRALAWLGVMLFAAGLGIFVKNHLDEIGPLTIAIALTASALACFVWVSLKPRRVLDEYVVLLGALIVSADLAFIETQWHLLGDEWQRHFLLLAVIHAALAYWFDSRAVLSLSIASLAAWFGVEQRNLFEGETQFAMRAFACAAVLVVWRLVNRVADFQPVFDQIAINIAFWGALVFTTIDGTKPLGLLATLAIAAAAVRLAFVQKREMFLMYAFVYTIIALNILLPNPFLILLSTVGGIGGLFVIHAIFQQHLAHA
ncbi:MAG TPA: DUF2157 domain-containing protein [Thermoanaerobaculia bacterium]|nr:DUF2157 domain-containing protein [Thermoanaerobaculia bacterium]